MAIKNAEKQVETRNSVRVQVRDSLKKPRNKTNKIKNKM
jgi:hypothetical protein